MSRVGKKYIELPDKVEVNLDGNTVKIKGPEGELEQELIEGITIEVDNRTIKVKRSGDTKDLRAKHGLMRSLLNNMVTGVSQGMTKSLEIIGVGYRAQMKGSSLELRIGYSHPIVLEPPKGIQFEVNANKITVKGISKVLVGEEAAKIRKLRPPEPYKGKGIRYSGEYVRRKAGKTGAV